LKSRCLWLSKHKAKVAASRDCTSARIMCGVTSRRTFRPSSYSWIIFGSSVDWRQISGRASLRFMTLVSAHGLRPSTCTPAVIAPRFLWHSSPQAITLSACSRFLSEHPCDRTCIRAPQHKHRYSDSRRLREVPLAQLRLCDFLVTFSFSSRVQRLACTTPPAIVNALFQSC